jgi:hypothetical protein
VTREGRTSYSLCVDSVYLCASVVNLPHDMITTETQRATEITQRVFFIPELKKQNPSTFLPREATGWRRDLFSEENFHGGLNTLARGVLKLQTASGQVSWLLHRRSLATIFTVARPRGILTRFPILPARRGTPKRI